MDNNFDNVFEELTPVTKNNRYSKQESDILFNPEKGKNGKFEVSESLFRRLNLNDNGFRLLTGQGSAYVGIVPNEEAFQYPGRSDAENKTEEFSSTEMRDALSEAGMEGNEFWLKWAGKKDDNDYYQIVDENPETTSSEEVAVQETEEATVETDAV